MQPNRRQFIVASGVALAGTGAISGTGAAQTSGAPAPDDPDQYDYPVTTEDLETPVATVYGGFDCPYTADMVAESFDDILEEFVEPGRLTLRFRALEYDENGDPYISQDGIMAGQAAGGVWQEDPEAFWDFFAAVYEEMPGDMSRSKIERIMNDAGVDNASYIADNLENWDPELQETADDAQAEGVDFTPTIELKGDLGNREDVVEWIEARLEDDGGQQESQDAQESNDSEETAQEDSGSGETSEQETSESTESGSSDARQADAGGDRESSGGQSGSGDEQSSSSDGGSTSSADDSDGGSSGSTGSSDSDSADGSGGSGGSGGTGGGGGSISCGDHHRASDPSHGGSSQTTQSFVFPEASGSRRFL